MNNFKLGRRPPKGAPALRLADYLTGQVPVVPEGEDFLAATAPQLEMLGNDTYGDCVAVTWANERLVITSLAGAGYYPDQADVYALYKTQNPGFPTQDDGMDIQTCLEHLVKVGGPDGVKALGFAKVNTRDQAEVNAAIALFKNVWTGIGVQSQNEEEFNSGAPWSYDPNGQDEGGHSVPSGGYGPGGEGALAGVLRFDTWAQETSFTQEFVDHQIDEGWVVIWPEHLLSATFLAGVDLQLLAADYEQITGKPFPAPVPAPPQPAPEPPAPPAPAPPAPEPTPEPPSPVDPLAALVAAFEKWLEGLFERQAPHPREVELAKAIKAYSDATGTDVRGLPE